MVGNRPNWNRRRSSRANTLSEIREQEARLAELSDCELRRFVDDLRERAHLPRSDKSELVVPVVASAKQAVHRVLGYSLFDVQLLAGLALIDGCVAEMQTGEGKTVSAVAAAAFGGVLGSGVHVSTPNTYLAERDYEQLKPIYELLGLEVGLLTVDAHDSHGKIQAYASDIVYGPGYEFGFDYLRDQLLLKKQLELGVGHRTLGRLAGSAIDGPVQRSRLGYSIVDEVDNVLIDDSSSPQVLSEFQPGSAPDEDAVQLARTLAGQLRPDDHYFELPSGRFELTKQGNLLIHDPATPIPTGQLSRPWARYIEAALRAELKFQKDVHYVVVDGQVRIVEQSTGRIFEDRSWQAGLHQAVEAKEGLTIKPESLPLAQITRQRFYRLYSQLSGMTGTAAGCAAEFREIYNLRVVEIPLRVPSKRIELPTMAFASLDEKWESIARSVIQLNRSGRPVLIGTRTIEESQVVAQHLESLGVHFELLNGKQDAEEAELISGAGQAGAITIATNLAGRGTDIKLSEQSRALGGLHVVVTECHASSRVDRQLVGRCARQGDPGSCQTFVSAEDWLFQAHAPWFADSLTWMVRKNAVPPNLMRKIEKIQRSIEQGEFASRLQLLKQTEKQNRVLMGAGI